MNTTLLRRSLPLFALAAGLAAQVPVTLRATPTDGSAAGCYYCPGYEHVIKLVGTQLRSTTVNLLPFHDLDVVMTGTWNGSVVTVDSVQLVAESFSIGGSGRIGNRFDFSSVAASGSLAVNCMAFGGGFAVPVGDLALQLAPATTMVLGIGPVTGGEFKVRLDIPDEPSLVGVRVFGQGLIVPNNGPAYTTNVDSKVIGS